LSQGYTYATTGVFEPGLADIDRDGHLDFVEANNFDDRAFTYSTVAFHPGLGDGTFATPGRAMIGVSTPGLLLVDRLTSIAVVDLNADDRTDCAATDSMRDRLARPIRVIRRAIHAAAAMG